VKLNVTKITYQVTAAITVRCRQAELVKNKRFRLGWMCTAKQVVVKIRVTRDLVSSLTETEISWVM